MFDDSDRFAFLFTTLHILATTGNAYDAAMTSDRIQTGDLLYIPTENVLAIAATWPIAVTAAHGKLHAYAGTNEDLDATLADMRIPYIAKGQAITAAQLLGLELAPAFAAFAT